MRGGGDPAASEPVALPLTFKGLVACLALVLYGGLMAAYVLAERQTMLGQIAALDERQSVEEALKRAQLAVSNALLALRQVSLDDDPAEAGQNATPFALEAVERALGAWRERMPGIFAQHLQARRRLATLAAQPSRANLLELRESLEMLGREVERESAREREERAVLAREFRLYGDRIALIALGLGLGGLVVFGGITALFFARLAADLRALGLRAKAIVGGYRGEPLEVTRRDEVGSLTRDVNHMAADLAQRESDLAVAGERRAHREKMASLGALARNLSHEIGNPLATISTLVQYAAGTQDEATRRAWQPETILQQTQRIAEITRQIADFSGPSAGAPEPVDVGGMLGMVCEFMQFDPRFRTMRLDVRLGPALPTPLVVPDELSEVLMNVVQSSLEAAGAAGRDRVVVEAAAAPGGVAIRVPGGSPGAGARGDRTRQLVEGMKGRLGEAGGVEVLLPAAT